MIFTYILPALLLSPILYLAIFKIKHKFYSLFLGNILWISLFIGVYVIDKQSESQGYLLTLIIPTIALSLTFTGMRIVKNIKLNKN